MQKNHYHRTLCMTSQKVTQYKNERERSSYENDRHLLQKRAYTQYKAP
jgi:hypothetical protein